MKLYFAPDSRAERIAWLLEELGLAYDLERYKLGDRAMREGELKSLHPLGRVPVLVDGDVTLFESGAIVQYILARYGNGRLQPAVDSPDFPQFLQWLHYTEGMIMPPVNIIVVETILLPPERRTEVNVKRATKLLDQMLNTINAHMEGRSFVAGDFSGADCMIGHASHVAQSLLGLDYSDKPHLEAYVERLRARPAMQKALSI